MLKLWTVIIGLIVLVIGILLWRESSPGPVEALRRARTALDARNYESAERWGRHALGADPDSAEGARIVAVAAMETGRTAEAERLFEQAIAADPKFEPARKGLVELLYRQGRSWDARPHLRRIVREGEPEPAHLLLALSPDELPRFDPSFLQTCEAAAPDDPLPRLRLAREKLRTGDPDAAYDLLRRLADETESMEVSAWLGTSLVLREDLDGIVRWNAGLSDEAAEHPRIWNVRGTWARRSGQPEAAARCFWESVRREPNDRSAVSQLVVVLTELDHDRVDVFHRWMERLVELENLVRWEKASLNPGAFPEVPRILEEMGRRYEARAWYDAALWDGFDHPEVVAARDRLTDELGPDSPWSANPADEVDLSGYPVPDWPEVDEGGGPASRQPPVEPSRIRFADATADVNVDFTFHSDADPTDAKHYLSEWDGGGAAVLDFDGNGEPDLYLTQGSEWPETTAESPLDQLLRNVGGRYEAVTESADVREDRYSQGVTVGDIDQDGFPDVFVANVGPNRMFLNNGDGTFTDITEDAGVAGGDDEWSSSCVLADLDGDTLPDLYVVNYLEAASLAGCPRRPSCAPTTFEGAQDRLYLNNGDGTFRDATEESGVVRPNGKGLGVLAIDLDGTGRLDLFVANDTTANFLFVNRAEEGPLLFDERAIARGLAYDADGLTQSCMGIAVADVNGDETLDLFVTNFVDEANTLYVQEEFGLFEDRTAGAGLRAKGFPMLGFGTQFLDADLDGDPDLVVANGHVNPFLDRGAMRPQCFENVGEGRFEEVTSAGPYFDRRLLGRPLARLDWNRDGRDEFVVTHIDAPAVVLVNETPTDNHFLALELVGTRSERDAIGTRVRVRSGDRTWAMQLTAGDGYQSSNERRLLFGLGDRDTIDEVTIQWPSGGTDELRGLTVDTRYVVVERGGARIVAE